MQTDLPRLDHLEPYLRSSIEKQCRLKRGEIWVDPEAGHVVGCGDAASPEFIERLCDGVSAQLAVHDPPYNFVMGQRLHPLEFASWCRRWITLTEQHLSPDSALYLWLGADQNNHFQPLPHVMLMMAETGFESRAFISLRNQRGYGTQKNWMAVRQELLYYTKGEPPFEVQYTEIPKILRGYYKKVRGKATENIERSHSETIRAGNIWVDIQQVFYRLEENVPGCFAQKPLKAIERIIAASSRPEDTVLDFFAHAGTSLLAAERLGRTCVTCDIDPLFAELTIRRLERFRTTGKTGWQRNNPFAREFDSLDRPALVS